MNAKRPKKVTLRVHILDFANILKAFIGTNYLTSAYAFKQSGLVFGIVGVLFIAAVTDHCCQLIVKCRHIVIDNLVNDFENDHDQEDSENGPDEAVRYRKRLQASLDYASVARCAAGNWVGYVVNSCIVVTQVGFCIGYCVFIGNTMHTLWPMKPVATQISAFNISKSSTVLPSVGHKPLSRGERELPHVILPSNITTSFPNVTSSTPAEMTTFESNTTSPMSITLRSSAPSLVLLVLSGLPIYALLTLFRSVRQMGWVSVIANVAVIIGFFSVLFSIVIVSPSIQLVKWDTLPVFFGLIVGAYEAIGTIIPIESGMGQNQRRFPAFLHGAVFVISLIIGALGIIGYLRFGVDTEQVLSHNISQEGIVYALVNGTLIVGVVFTYPLQIFPVVELLENKLFAYGNVCGPKYIESDQEKESNVGLLSDSVQDESTVVDISPKVPAWKRNLVRCILAIFLVGAAAVLRNVFAYISAFVGAVGSCPLVFIIPPFLHYKLTKNHTGLGLKAKNVVIACLGVIFAIISTFTVFQELIYRL